MRSFQICNKNYKNKSQVNNFNPLKFVARINEEFGNKIFEKLLGYLVSLGKLEFKILDFSLHIQKYLKKLPLESVFDILIFSMVKNAENTFLNLL